MKKTILLFFLFSFAILRVFGQQETSTWYFGNNAGLEFTGDQPIALNDGQMSTIEGCSTISDDDGNILFYTDGLRVWDSTNQVMPNGEGLTGNHSSTQSALIIPKPGSSNLYYIFTTDSEAGSNGLKYSLVDMSLNSGLGDVTSIKNEDLIANVTEKISAVLHADNFSYWLLAHQWGNNNFLAYKINEAGINVDPVISSVGTVHGVPVVDENFGVVYNFTEAIGHLKFSPNGSRIAIAKAGGVNAGVEVFNFNTSTGEVSDPIFIFELFDQNISSIEGAYGVEFSRNSNRLYVSTHLFSQEYASEVHQFDLSLSDPNDVINSDTVIYSSQTILGALQLAVDGKIYVSNFGKTSLDVIANPNSLGLNVDYINEYISLNDKVATLGLPSFVQSFFNPKISITSNCFGESTNFEIPQNLDALAVTWDFGDGSFSNVFNPTHTYQNQGSYTVTATITSATETIFLTEEVNILNQPIVNEPDNYYLCSNNNTDFMNFNLRQKAAEIRAGQTEAELIVEFYTSEINAINSISPLSYNYTNVSNPQTLYARVYYRNSPDCFNLTSFNLFVLPSPRSTSEIVYLCRGETIELDGGDGYDLFNWSTGETTQSITINQSGIYSVEINNLFNTASQEQILCSNTKEFIVTESDKATVLSIEVNDLPNEINTITITVNGIGDYQYSLDNVNYQDANVFTNVPAGDHTVFVKDKNGCGKVSEDVYLLSYPKFFTPNNDGMNDYWNVKPYFSEPDLLIEIFDRYGKRIAKFKGNSQGWDGTFEGKSLPANDYWFKVIRPNINKVFTGHFSLRR
ncbi:T9SS type B sorting domain-containing protein [Winogradskyella algicola]|uniref:T9SS type B sorting domain-containing protein n=1 Tax=Winogradskyella algicola TaxID=2575815 RepID=UPI001108B0C8|nr:T9SS type B sorting domain-containing protein [Winogradskyella algicola]